MRDSYLIDKTVRVKLGTPEVDAEDYCTIYTGRIEDWKYDGHELELAIRDYHGKLEAKIPTEDTGTGIPDTITYDKDNITHPGDIMKDIIQTQIGVADRNIDLDSFTEITDHADLLDAHQSRSTCTHGIYNVPVLGNMLQNAASYGFMILPLAVVLLNERR